MEDDLEELVAQRRRRKCNRWLNISDFCLLMFINGQFYLLMQYTHVMDSQPSYIFLYQLQQIFAYLMFRLKYVEQDRCCACLQCDMGMLYKFHFSNMLFCIFILLVGGIDIGKSMLN